MRDKRQIKRIYIGKREYGKALMGDGYWKYWLKKDKESGNKKQGGSRVIRESQDN